MRFKPGDRVRSKNQIGYDRDMDTSGRIGTILKDVGTMYIVDFGPGFAGHNSDELILDCGTQWACGNQWLEPAEPENFDVTQEL